jgi:hypothetical protein
MWTRTRSSLVQGQNETILEADTKRLTQWRLWLKHAAKNPGLILQATPVCGVWQLQFIVHNVAPAVQKVLVERQAPDGSWHELASRHTIEFRAYAARPRTKIQREFTVPLVSPQTPLRLQVGGVGQVEISHLVATNGLLTLPVLKSKGRIKLGVKPVSHGFPDVSVHEDRQRPLIVKFRFPANSV